MAAGSNTTLVIELSRLPMLPGVDRLAHKSYRTRASTTNAAYVEPFSRMEGKADPVHLELFHDAQTSGGLLISVPAERAELLVESARKRGAASACIIGKVLPKEEAALVVRA
jgi:selenide,water dikinase